MRCHRPFVPAGRPARPTSAGRGVGDPPTEGWSTAAFIATPRARVFGPARFHLVVLVTGLDDEGLLRPTAASNHADRGAALRVEPLYFPAGKLDDRDVAVVGEKSSPTRRRRARTSRRPRGYSRRYRRGTLGDLGQRERVPGLDLRRDADLNRVAHAHAFRREHEPTVVVLELDLRERSRAAGSCSIPTISPVIVSTSSSFLCDSSAL